MNESISRINILLMFFFFFFVVFASDSIRVASFRFASFQPIQFVWFFLSFVFMFICIFIHECLLIQHLRQWIVKTAKWTIVRFDVNLCNESKNKNDNDRINVKPIETMNAETWQIKRNKTQSEKESICCCMYTNGSETNWIKMKRWILI